MLGPGEYVADETQGITRVEDLPKPKFVRRSRNYKRQPCPLCEHSTYRPGRNALDAVRQVKALLDSWQKDVVDGRPEWFF